MRDEQFQKLEDLQERLVDAILVEADPDHWVANGKLPKEMTQEERGNRYWCKRNAAASLTVLNKTLSLAHFRDRMPVKTPEQFDAANDELDKDIRQAEKEASRVLKIFEERQAQKAK